MKGTDAADPAAPAWHRLPWWDIIFVVVCALGIGTGVLYESTREPVEPWRIAAIVALLIGVLAVWFAVARRHVGPDPLGYASLAVIATLMIAAMTISSPLGILQGALFPYLWSVLEHTRRSVVASAVVAVGVLVFGVAASGWAVLPTLLITQSLSFLLSVGIGLAITYAWNVAEQRQRLLVELTATQQRLAELSHQQGVSLERERLSRELHDTLAQTLAGLTLIAERAVRGSRRAVELGEPLDAPLAAIDQVAELSRTALAETRALIAESAPVHGEADAPGGARGGAADGLSFRAAIERLAERFRREARIEVAVDLPSVPEALEAVARDHQVVLLRCLQEGLANVRRHANATRADVRLEVDDVGTLLEIVDDGRGFDPDRATGTGFGLPGLRDRARLLDGDVAIDTAPGAGTRVRVRLPGTTADAPRAEATHPTTAMTGGDA